MEQDLDTLWKSEIAARQSIDRFAAITEHTSAPRSAFMSTPNQRPKPVNPGLTYQTSPKSSLSEGMAGDYAVVWTPEPVTRSTILAPAVSIYPKDEEKAHHSLSEKGELPLPSASPAPRQSTGRNVFRRLVLAATSLYAFVYLFGNPITGLRGSQDLTVAPHDQQGPLAIYAPESVSTNKKHNKHKEKHGSKHHKGKGGKGGKGKKHGPPCDNVQPIYPNKKVEEVYLSIPTNESARE